MTCDVAIFERRSDGWTATCECGWADTAPTEPQAVAAFTRHGGPTTPTPRHPTTTTGETAA